MWLANPLIASGENHVSSKLIMRKEKIPVYYFRSFFLRAVALLKYAQNSPPAEISRLSKKGKQFFSLAAFAGDGGKGGGDSSVLFFPFLILLEWIRARCASLENKLGTFIDRSTRPFRGRH